MISYDGNVRKENNFVNIFLETNDLSIKYVHGVHDMYQNGI